MKKAFSEKERHRLPSFDCPNPDCSAKNIVFAISREAKNESELISLQNFSGEAADFVVVCPKCKREYVLCRHREKPILSLYDLPSYGRIAT